MLIFGFSIKFTNRHIIFAHHIIFTKTITALCYLILLLFQAISSYFKLFQAISSYFKLFQAKYPLQGTVFYS